MKFQLLPLTVTYNRKFSNIKRIIQYQWSIIKTNKALEKTFSVEAIISFSKTKSLKKIKQQIRRLYMLYVAKKYVLCTGTKHTLIS